jgi:hypothetical protein
LDADRAPQLKAGVGFLLVLEKMKLLKKRRLWISLTVLITIFGLGLFAYRALEKADKEFKESKWVRTTLATVIRKEPFRCEEKACFYTSGYGDRVEMKQGESQQRVYYQIENFDQVDEPRRSRVAQAEKDRVRQFGPRFSYADDWYAQVEPGAKLYVRYRCFSDGEIQVWGVDTKP